MATCPNKNLESWKTLVTSRGEDVAYFLWDQFDGNVPESESRSSIVKAGLKSVNALQSDKAIQLFNTLTKNKVTGDMFWNKIQQDLAIPKDQVELLKSFDTTNREELITNMLANYSFAIEINTALSKDTTLDFNDPRIEFKDNSKYYSNLTVPGGTNYTENEIATPAITPSIKGHAQFATDQGIGWFRSDEQLDKGDNLIGYKGKPIEYGVNEAQELRTEQEVEDYMNKYDGQVDIEEVRGTFTKTRRILEVQSDLFQKGRDKEDLITNVTVKQESRFSLEQRTFMSSEIRRFESIENPTEQDKKDFNEFYTKYQKFREEVKKEEDYTSLKSTKNQFLQLLNKANNWVTFFVKSIIQDSAKKGYEKVLFPSGNTASKVEGHTTLEEFKKQKEDRIKDLEEEIKKDRKSIEEGISPEVFKSLKDMGAKGDINYLNESNRKQKESFIKNNENEIAQLKQELERVEGPEGFGALKPIYNFYENTVANVLKKQGYNPKQVTDEYGNTWNEITISKDRDQQAVLFQTEEMPMSKASTETVNKVKQVLEKMGISIKDLAEYAKEAKINVRGVNGVADISSKLIAIAEGKEDIALTEEMVHIATAILEQKNPQLVTEMISKIDRFAIYQRTLDTYKNNPAYQLPNGKPNIRKIKKEAVDKLISELIINNNEGTTDFPELLQEENRSVIRTWWRKILDFISGFYKKSNIDIFQEVAETIMKGEVEASNIDLSSYDLYYQVSDNQKVVQQKIKETLSNIKKVEDKQATDPILMDTEEASNWYEAKQPDGTWARLTKRVTDRVKSWYRQRFPGKVFTEEEKRFNELKRSLGIKGHKFFEDIHSRYFNVDQSSDEFGTRRKNVEPRSIKLDRKDEEIYEKLEKYYAELIAKFSEGNKNPLVFSEVMIYDPKEKEAGTIDFLIVEDSGKVNIIDWKFMSIAQGADDVAWFKQGAFNIQLGRYKDILRDYYGAKDVGMNRAIPIIMDIKPENFRVENSPLRLAGISIGSVDVTKIEDLRLVPVSEESESTGFASLDKLIKELNAVYKQIGKEIVTEEEEKEFKRDRLNILKKAIRTVQGTLNIAPLVEVIKVMRKEGDILLNDYKTIYEGRPANSKGEDFTDDKLSDFSADMREYIALSNVFGRVDDLIGDLIYNESMEKDAKTKEDKENLNMRKELLENISKEARSIRLSSTEIKDVSKKFADKFIGEKNLVTGLLSPEAVVKGLGATFRGVSDLPMASLQVLYKIVTNAKSMASRTALGSVDKLMEIRKKLVDRGGDTRKLVQQIYQKDDSGKIVNKLIYKYDKKFYEGVDNNALEGKRSKKWLLENIDVDEYRKQSKELLRKKLDRIEKLYDDGDLKDRLIREEYQKWDIDRDDFIGWNNYIIKRNPLKKWESKEYIDLQKDPELLELFNFITEMNEKAKSAGYIGNKVASTFLPFVRKSMAESLAWDFGLSAITNFGSNLTMNADDVGYGQINELTGELENAIPKYYTYDFTRTEDGVNDYSDVSEDLFKNMILYINHMEKYKYLSDVEDQLQLVKTIETFKGYLATNTVGEVVYDKNGRPVVLSEGQSSSEGNAKMYNDFLRALLYEQKYPLSDSDTPLGLGKVSNFFKKAVNNIAGREVFKPDENPSATSLVKSMDAANRAFQLKTLGLEFVSGAVNAFGGNIQVATQAGNYFKSREFLKNEMLLVGNKFKNDDEREMFIQMIDTFMPLKDDPTYDKLQAAGLTALTRANFSDMLFVFMREPEQHIEKSIFLTLLDNMMVDNGKIVSIPEFVKSKYKNRYDSSTAFRETSSKIEEEIEELKKTKSISATKKLENGKLVIPGLDLTNTNEIQRLTNLTRRISRNATGNLADSDLNRMQMNVFTRSMMVFKNWIPKLVDTRFGEFRKVSDDFSVEIGQDGMTTGEKYDIGRLRLFAYVIGTSIRDKTSNIYNILSVNDKGLAVLDQMYEEFATDYQKRTGKVLTMTREDFIDMVRTNLRNQVKELAILLSLFGSMIALGFVAPDDDDDRADKNFYRYSQRVVDKFIGELSFFYNPVEFHKMLSGSMFPALGLFSDITRFTSHFFKETTGLDLDDYSKTAEEVRKEAQPVKNLAKMFPITKSIMTYGAILDADFAKEFDITIQKESRR